MSRLARLGFIDIRRTSDPVRRKVRSRGVPPALAGHEIFYTEDVREATRLVSRALSPLTLIVDREHADGFAATMHGVRLRNVSMLYLDLHIAATIDIPESGRYYAVHMPLNGGAAVQHPQSTFQANAMRCLVTSPGTPLRIALEHDSPQLLIRIEEQAMTTLVTRLIGRKMVKPLVFTPEFDLATEAAMRWNAAVQLVHTEVYHPGSLVQNGRGISSVEELVMSSLLYLQPSTYHDDITRPVSHSPRHAVIQRVMDYIDDHLAERITMHSLARAAHMSVRSIQQGFHDELGMSPMAFVRERRLERVHSDLADAIPADGVTVTAVAERWGFHHLGSFSAEYRKRWGEAPSATLRH